VGKNNYKYFFMFISLVFIVSILSLVQTIIGIVNAANNHEPAFIAFNVILGLYCLLAILFVGTLIGLHTYLSKNNITTN